MKPENNIQRFLPVFAAVMHESKSPIRVLPESLSINANTCAARLRDAIKDVRKFKVLLPNLNQTELNKRLAGWEVAIVSNEVHLRARGSGITEPGTTAIVASPHKRLDVSHEQFAAFLCLVGGHLIEGEFVLHVSSAFDEPTLDEFRDHYDVSILPQSDHATYLVF